MTFVTHVFRVSHGEQTSKGFNEVTTALENKSERV